LAVFETTKTKRAGEQLVEGGVLERRAEGIGHGALQSGERH
jgi:hypothetical protein